MDHIEHESCYMIHTIWAILYETYDMGHIIWAQSDRLDWWFLAFVKSSNFFPSFFCFGTSFDYQQNITFTSNVWSFQWNKNKIIYKLSPTNKNYNMQAASKFWMQHSASSFHMSHLFYSVLKNWVVLWNSDIPCLDKDSHTVLQKTWIYSLYHESCKP